MIRFANHLGDGELLRMGQRDRDVLDPEPLRPSECAAMKLDLRRPTPLSGYLDVTPSNASSAGAKSLHDRLLGSETTGELRRSTTTVRDLSVGIHALKETSAVPFGDLSDAGNLDDVDARY